MTHASSRRRSSRRVGARAARRLPAPATTDAGCQVTRQLVLPGTTPLTLLPDVRIDRVGDGLRADRRDDDTAVRWAISTRPGPRRGAVVPLPRRHASSVLRRSPAPDAPGDTLLVGLLGHRRERHRRRAAFRGRARRRLGGAAARPRGATFPGAPIRGARLVGRAGASASGMYAGAAWLDSRRRLVRPRLRRRQGAGRRARVLETRPPSGYVCLGLHPGQGAS